MKSSSSILNALYQLINKDELNSNLSGLIYKAYGPLKIQNEFVVINILHNPNEYLQDGFANVNFYCSEDNQGRADTKKFAEISPILINLIDKKNHSDIYFQVVNESGILKDRDRDNMSFVNLKINYQTL